MPLTRRDLLRAGVVSGTALAAGPAFYPSRHVSAAPRVLDPRGTTLERTVRRGAPGTGGYVQLVAGPGEPHVVRDDLGTTARSGRGGRRLDVAAFVHLTDVHILDAQSPGRVEFLDRYSDPPADQTPFSSAYRPQEMLTLQIADAMCRTVSDLRRGPVTGRALEFAISTGDNIDNAQLNELRWFIDVLDGARVVPDSGDLARWEGVHDVDPLTYDVHYWHPDGTPGRAGAEDDLPRRVFGFPTIPGLLDAARRPFDAHGLQMPWFSVFGNHDSLLQGNAPPNSPFSAIYTGPVKVVSLPAGISPADMQRGLQEQDPAVLTALASSPARVVSADAARRPLSRKEIIEEHFTTVGAPVGHGFTQANVDAEVGYYAFDHGAHLRCVVLDTVNPGGYADGSIDRTQLEWLTSELESNSRTMIDASGAVVDTGSTVDRLVVVFSHHSVGTMVNPVLAPGETEPRVLGPGVVAVLLRFPNVVLWVNGHTHKNGVQPHTRAGGGGFWEVNTAAHIDFPSQSRAIEIVDNLDGTLSIFTTVIDLDVPLAYGGDVATTSGLASLAREVGANDWQDRTAGREGVVEARNAELLVAAPFELRHGRPGSAPPTSRPVDRPLPSTGAERDGALAGAGLLVTAAAFAAAARWSGPRSALPPRG